MTDDEPRAPAAAAEDAQGVEPDDAEGLRKAQEGKGYGEDEGERAQALTGEGDQ